MREQGLTVHPYYFGPSGRQLLGVRHPAVQGPGEHAVVICYPQGHEYVNALRGCRQLATRLARVGISVLRFDHYGCGDSAGLGDEARLRHWLDDMMLAIDEVRSWGSVRRVSLIGLRLGASLAALSAARDGNIDQVVLWEPVLNGSAYLEALRGRQAAFLESEAAEGREQHRYSGTDEIVGFPLSPALAEDLTRIDPATILGGRIPRRALVIGDGDPDRLQALSGSLAARGSSVTTHQSHEPGIWMRDVGQPRALVPTPLLEFIVEWVAA